MSISINNKNKARDEKNIFGYYKKTVDFLKGNNKMFILICIAIFGIMFIFLGSDKEGADTVSSSHSTVDEGKYDMIEYSEYIEKKIKGICEHINGVSSVYVIVTLENGFEYVYAINETSSKDKEIKTYDYLVIKDGNSENVVYLTGKPPKIKGIGIIYTINSKLSAKYEIVNLISSAFDVGKNKVYIIERKK